MNLYTIKIKSWGYPVAEYPIGAKSRAEAVARLMKEKPEAVNNVEMLSIEVFQSGQYDDPDEEERLS